MHSPARAVYGALRETPGTRAHRLHQALLQVQQTQRYVADLRRAIELAEDQQYVA
jgi:hypothetical protein